MGLPSKSPNQKAKLFTGNEDIVEVGMYKLYRWIGEVPGQMLCQEKDGDKFR